MSMLDYCDGPECTKCGCRDVKVMTEARPDVQSVVGDQVYYWPQPGCAVCNHCNTRFSFSYVMPAPEEPDCCDECGSPLLRTVSSPAPENGVKVRYQKCANCDNRQKSCRPGDELNQLDGRSKRRRKNPPPTEGKAA